MGYVKLQTLVEEKIENRETKYYNKRFSFWSNGTEDNYYTIAVYRVILL